LNVLFNIMFLALICHRFLRMCSLQRGVRATMSYIQNGIGKELDLRMNE